MDFKQLRAFLTVAETGNVTRAAELLCIVQPAVSRQLRLLEEDIGAELFERERHGMTLTDAGVALQEYARRVMTELERARAQISGSVDGVGGLVTIGLLPSTSDLLASDLVHLVARQYPGIKMRIAMGYAGNLQQWLETGEIDAAILYNAERMPNIHATPLLEEQLWVVGDGTSGLRADRPVAFASLAGQAMVLPSGPYGIRTLLDHACAVSGVALTVAVETNAMGMQKSLVLGGHGLTILPPIAFSTERTHGQLLGAPLCEPELTRTIALAVPANRAVSKHVRRVVELLKECAQNAVQRGAWFGAHWLKS